MFVTELGRNLSAGYGLKTTGLYNTYISADNVIFFRLSDLIPWPTFRNFLSSVKITTLTDVKVRNHFGTPPTPILNKTPDGRERMNQTLS